MTSKLKKFKIGLCQMEVTNNIGENINVAKTMIYDAADKGADIVVLPEIWNCPYSPKYFEKFAEEEMEKTFDFMESIAKEKNIFLVGGSIPEKSEEDGKIYNTSFVFNRNGELIAKHRKVHLFDIDIPNGVTFSESSIFSAGKEITTFDTEFGKIGLAICFDIRFPEQFTAMSQKDIVMAILPAAFNMTTGPAHWEVSIRARALDNQIFFAAISPARNTDGHYKAWGHSCISDPWGKIIAQVDEKSNVIVQEIDLNIEEKIRTELPLLLSKKLETKIKIK